jgi:putative ABC transport system permease protein
VTLMSLSPGRAGYTGARRLQYYRDVLDRVRALPGIEEASVAMITPISGGGVDLSLVVEGRPAEPDNMVYVNDVSDGYFRTMGTALRLGRDFTADDRESSPAVAVINEALVRRYFPSGTPIGQRVRLGRDSLLEIVGVVENAKYLSLREPDRPTIYVNALQKVMTGGLTLTIRSASGAADAAAVRREVLAVASTVPIGRPSILSTDIDRSLVNERLMANLLGAFAALALVLACAGLYGVLGYAVARRTSEIGLRLALGATRGEVLRSVLGQSARLVAIGLMAGVAAALLATRLLSDLLYGVTAADGRVLLMVISLIALVAALSALRPAWRASRVDPMVALRHN